MCRQEKGNSVSALGRSFATDKAQFSRLERIWVIFLSATCEAQFSHLRGRGLATWSEFGFFLFLPPVGRSLGGKTKGNGKKGNALSKNEGKKDTWVLYFFDF